MEYNMIKNMIWNIIKELLGKIRANNQENF